MAPLSSLEVGCCQSSQVEMGEERGQAAWGQESRAAVEMTGET